MTWVPLIAAAAIVLADILIARGRRKHWETIAYAHGQIDGVRTGDKRGFTRGYSQACLDHVLAQPDEAEHYAGIVGQLPDACDSAAFAEVLLNGGLREGLHEGAFPWEAS